MLDLIAKRMALAKRVRKAKSGMNVWRPAREESHVRDLARKAEDTPPELVSHIWAELTSASLSLQGPIALHIAAASDALSQWSLVRDRFGASIPSSTYPTASAALAAASADPEGVAVLPAPGGMNNWWTALAPGAAAESMHILSALPRTGDWDWPQAVALSKVVCEPSGDDLSLVILDDHNLKPPLTTEALFARSGLQAVLRAAIGEWSLYSIKGYLDDTEAVFAHLQQNFRVMKRVGVLPAPIRTDPKSQ